MKIAFIVPEFPSISQTFVLNQITGLMDRGHEVEIFAATSNNDEKYHHDVLKYDLLSRTAYFPKIPACRLKRTFKGAKYVLSHFPKHPKIVLTSLNIAKFGRLATSFTLIYRIIPFLGKGSYDIVHCHFGPLGNIAVQCRRAGALKGKIITTFHGYDLTSYPKKNGPRVYDMLFKYGDLCLPISHHWKNRLIEMGCKEEKIAVHRMGVDLKHFNLRKENRPKSGMIKILSVARLVEKKGIQYSIEAISKVIERFSNIEYLIVGDGPLRPQLEQMIKHYRLERYIRLLGWMNQKEVNDLMEQSDILLVPSVTAKDGDQEGIPVVLMEALAMGLPVISTYHSGIPELIIDGQTGLLVPERDSSALADKLNELISSDTLNNELRKNGKNYVKENFNVDLLNSTLENIYLQLLN